MGETQWLDADEQHAWRQFLQMQSQLRSRISKQLKAEQGLSEADYEVLVHLSEEPSGRLRPYELGKYTLWETSRLSHHLSRMVERGLVTREVCPTDQRGALIALTDLGRTTIEQAAPTHVGHVRRWFLDA